MGMGNQNMAEALAFKRTAQGREMGFAAWAGVNYGHLALTKQIAARAGEGHW